MINLQESMQRMKEGAFNVFNLHNLDGWLQKYTFIEGKPFNFKDREFQLDILKDTKREQVVVKCAQVGLSELSYRWAVAACCVRENTNVIYTFPSTTDAENNNITRINPMIEGSPEISRLVSPELNNSRIKKFGKNSFLYFRGTLSETAALSTPADAVISDEYDKSDMDNVTTYTSRLQDRPTKIRKIFSTPTVSGYGVDKEARTANRLFHFVKCNKCNHSFLPDYFTDVKIPGYNKPLEEITKENLPNIDYKNALLLCPQCGRDPEMHYTRMPWVCENPDIEFIANAWFVSPFSAHKRISVPYLIESSTKYRKYSEFKNQALGITAEDKNEAITLEDIQKLQALHFNPSTDIHQMGVDLGTTCHITIGRELDSGEILVVHRERVHYSRLTERQAELRSQYNVSTQVLDSQPYSDIVNTVCGYNPNAWGAVYIHSKNAAIFTAKEQEQNLEEAKLGFRTVNINRNAAFDELMALIKSGKLIISKSDENHIFEKQMLCMKRTQKFDRSQELHYVWVKTGDEDDHYHHSLLYFYIAVKLRMTAGSPGIAAAGIPLVRKFSTAKKLRQGRTW